MDLVVQQTRICSLCKNNLPISDFYVRNRVLKNGKLWTGFEGRCKNCYCKVAAKWTRNNKSKVMTYQINYRKIHRKELNEQAKKYRQIPEVKLKSKLRVRPEGYGKKRWLKRKEHLKRDKSFREKVRKNQRANNARFYKAHGDSIRKEAQLASQIRRAKLRGNSSQPVSNTIMDDLMLWQHGICAYCHYPLTNSLRKTHLDHVFPLARGGEHTTHNLVLACQHCNISKWKNLYMWEWLPDDISPTLPDNFHIEEHNGMRFIILHSFLLSNMSNPSGYKKAVESIHLANPELFMFWDFEWAARRSCVEAMLQVKSGKSHSLQARKLQVVTVPSDVAREKLEEWHLQGAIYTGLYLGLESPNGTLEGISAWKETQTHIELCRMAFRTHIIGGFSKLLTAYSRIKTSSLPIISFVDPRYATGQSYPKVGFQKTSSCTSKVMSYLSAEGIMNRQFLMKHRMRNFPEFDSKKTEWENALVHGFSQLYALKLDKYSIHGLGP